MGSIHLIRVIRCGTSVDRRRGDEEQIRRSDLAERGSVNVGIVGLGKMGLLHAGAISVLPDANLIAVCERNPRIAQIATRVFTRIPVVRTVEHLAGLDLDAIYITTPIPSHFSIVELVCTQG